MSRTDGYRVTGLESVCRCGWTFPLTLYIRSVHGLLCVLLFVLKPLVDRVTGCNPVGVKNGVSTSSRKDTDETGDVREEFVGLLYIISSPLLV